MSYLESTVKTVPTGIRKVLYLNWALVLLLCGVASFGFLMLFSVAGGSLDPWMGPQLQRFGLGLGLMFLVAMVPLWFWRSVSPLAYLVSVALLVYVDFFGDIGKGAQRWIDLGFINLQPSELAKITAPTQVLYVKFNDARMTDAITDAVYQMSFSTLPGARLKRIDNSAHFIMFDQPTAFYDELDAFLSAK